VTAPRRGPIVREATDDDAAALASFECSTGAWYEEEVQAYIHERALTHAHENPDGYRLLVAFEQTRLIAVAAHASEALILPEDDTYLAARLQVLAIAVADQRRRLPDRSRLSDVLMATLISDAIEDKKTDVVTAIVADENLRSIALCERNGLRSQTRHSSRYLRLTGRLQRPA
jgi:ribosomal protein S18 acetylase RimI-like enzyme